MKLECCECSAREVKLWRTDTQYTGSVGSNPILWCAECACRSQGITAKFDDAGRRRDPALGLTDMIGDLIPAVPFLFDNTFYRYIHIPVDGLRWWRRLPLRLSANAEIADLRRREPTQEEGDAAEGRPDDDGRTPPPGEVFVTGHTGRRCRVCRKWVWGGPTACELCVVREETAAVLLRAKSPVVIQAGVGITVDVLRRQLAETEVKLAEKTAECERRHQRELELAAEKLRLHDVIHQSTITANTEAHKNAAWWKNEVEKRDAEIAALKAR